MVHMLPNFLLCSKSSCQVLDGLAYLLHWWCLQQIQIMLWAEITHLVQRRATGWKAEKWRFDSRQKEEISLFSLRTSGEVKNGRAVPPLLRTSSWHGA
jgi:hypothetical protein